MNIATDNLVGHHNLLTIMMNTILITLRHFVIYHITLGIFIHGILPLRHETVGTRQILKVSIFTYRLEPGYCSHAFLWYFSIPLSRQQTTNLCQMLTFVSVLMLIFIQQTRHSVARINILCKFVSGKYSVSHGKQYVFLHH
jgi:hypothetical protein